MTYIVRIKFTCDQLKTPYKNPIAHDIKMNAYALPNSSIYTKYNNKNIYEVKYILDQIIYTKYIIYIYLILIIILIH